MDASEHDRRVTALVHTAMLAAIGVYGVVLLFFRAEIGPKPRRPESAASLFVVFAALGAAQFAGASLVGRRLLGSRRSGIADRVRLYFLLRAAAAEAIALYGFVLGFLGAPAIHVLALFALSVGALLLCSPGRAAWEAATQEAAQRQAPPGDGAGVKR